jgi:type IV pilus assembly protein PilV
MKKRMQGFTLIEVMIAVFVFAVGLLGLAGLQLKSYQFTHMSHARTIATLQASSIIERMRVNNTGVSNGAYIYDSLNDAEPGVDGNCLSTAGCGSNAMAATDLKLWLDDLATALPGSEVVVCQDSTPELTPTAGLLSNINCDGGGAASEWVIYIDWVDQKNLEGRDPSNLATKRFTMSFIP